MTTFNVALIGAGRMGQLHLTNLLAHPAVALKYIYDPMISTTHQIPVVKDLNVILDDKSIDACIIATPSTMHAELISACAHAHKHVFCEKPVSFHLDVLAKVKNVVEKAGIHVQIGFNRRFDPSYQSIHDEIAQNKLGAIHVIKITNRDPLRARLDFVKDSGGLFFDFNVHDFDMLRFIANDEVAEIFAVGDALVDEALREYSDIDTAIITAKMASGALAVIDCSRETGYGYDQQLEVLLDGGMLHAKNQNSTEVFVRAPKEGLKADVIHYSFVERYRESYRREVDHFFLSLGKKSATPNIDDAIAAVRIAIAAQKSCAERRSVRVSE